MRTRAYRRHQAYRHMWRRLKEDRNEHYNRLDCPCWTDKRAMARFKEQPQVCSCRGCGNQRKYEGSRHSENRAKATFGFLFANDISVDNDVSH